MRARLVWLAGWLTATGCGFEIAVRSDAGTDPDSVDAPAIDGCTTFSQQLDTCAQAGSDLVLDGVFSFDTDTGVLIKDVGTAPAVTSAIVTTTTNMVPVRALYVTNLTLAANARLRAVGTRPLAIVASGQVTLASSSVISVAKGGAGARTTCATAAMPGENDSNGAAGGGGGGFGGAGGRGGDGNSDGTDSVGGTQAPAEPVPIGPVGGCPGARGGTGGNGEAGGDGGAGGGAIYIVSAVAIELAADAGIHAGGGGGGGGAKTGLSQYGDAGGGGGGAGGMILLEAPRVRTGILAANGGGGGEGSGNGDAGNPGGDGVMSATRANGGSGGTSTGADGGRGGAGTTLNGDQPGQVQAGGGGGGGGGVGVIRIVSPDMMLGVTSPEPR